MRFFSLLVVFLVSGHVGAQVPCEDYDVSLYTCGQYGEVIKTSSAIRGSDGVCTISEAGRRLEGNSEGPVSGIVPLTRTVDVYVSELDCDYQQFEVDLQDSTLLINETCGWATSLGVTREVIYTLINENGNVLDKGLCRNTP